MSNTTTAACFVRLAHAANSFKSARLRGDTLDSAIRTATEFAREIFEVPADQKPEVVSSWGPYMSTVGTAKKTGVAGLTAPAAR